MPLLVWQQSRAGGIEVTGVVTTSFIGDITGDVTGNKDSSTAATL